MPIHHHTRATLQINRAPVLTLWAAIRRRCTYPDDEFSAFT